jgi:hypothetical protein
MEASVHCSLQFSPLCPEDHRITEGPTQRLRERAWQLQPSFSGTRGRQTSELGENQPSQGRAYVFQLPPDNGLSMEALAGRRAAVRIFDSRTSSARLDGLLAFDLMLEPALHVVDSVCEHVVCVRHRVGDVLHSNVVLDGEGIEDFPDLRLGLDSVGAQGF